MIKILFICYGNICRSPMAEFIMKDLAKKAGMADRLYIASAATSPYEAGSPVYPPARGKLAEHGLSCKGKQSCPLSREDYAAYDLLIGMDAANLREMRRICGGDPEGKMHMLLKYAGLARDVEDPWFTRDFEQAWRDISRGCEALMADIQQKQKEKQR